MGDMKSEQDNMFHNDSNVESFFEIMEAGQTKYACANCTHVSSKKSSLIIHIQAIHEGIRYPCFHCNYMSTTRSSLAMHVKSIHEKLKFKCSECTYQATTKSSLKVHKESIHQGKKYTCTQCGYKGTTKGSLRVHQQAKHTGIRYPCNFCHYQATTRSSLTMHIKSIHMKQKYSCSQCDHQATTKSSLARHKEAIHDGIRYPCDHCSYQATTKSSLTKHKIAKHKQVNLQNDQIKTDNPVEVAIDNIASRDLIDAENNTKPENLALENRSENHLKEFLEVAEDLKKGLIEEKKPNVKLADKTNTWSRMDTSECEQDRIKNEVPENTEDENEFVDEHVDQTPYDGSDDLLCTICELKLKNRKSFRNHMVCKHNYPKHKPTEYKCEVCNKVFTIRRLFNRCKHEPLNQSEDVIEPQDAIEHPDVPNEKNEMVLSLPF
eukprot:GFUD01051776.1.p1 GENE.GFUD01051776.1~~GFUD01051776.1.p1  ORF type:complete len:500 (+),score=57.79 GFUD01051776.1:197-1501(+)